MEMKLFDDYYVATKADDLLPESALVVWGGEDISPSLYGKDVSEYTNANDRPSMRDRREWALMLRAKEMGLPIIGICRGAQMLCALAGGFLVQDVTNHGRSHGVVTKDQTELFVSSLHHQMLYPFAVEHDMIAWTPQKLSNHYMDVNNHIHVEVEPEFVYFPKERGIAIQWHPEYMDVDCPANLFVKEKIKEYCNV
jgi:putative glutamine amidotransferase